MSAADTHWRPTISPGVLEKRARMLARARDFFSARSILEIDTPALTISGVTDPHIASLTTNLSARSHQKRFLHTSPEYAMKRLLAAGAPDIYQICKVFRDHEIGAHHQPEFTLVEWYRHDATLDDIINETCAFIATVCDTIKIGVDQYRYRQIFLDTCQLDPLTAELDLLAEQATRLIDTVTPELGNSIGTDRNAWLDLLMSHVVTPGLAADRLSVIHHFPADQAALARFDPDEPELAERFEVFMGSLELANGYRELTDATEQRRRLKADLDQRRRANLPALEPDQALLAALDHGLPECSGVAVGFDRLVMTACGLKNIDQAVTFAC